MIENPRIGGKRPEYGVIAGRIVMVDAMVHWQAYTKPAKVIQDDGRNVTVAPLRKYYDAQLKRYLFVDDAKLDDRYRIDKNSVKLVCDFAAEVNLIMAAACDAEREWLELKGRQEKRIAALLGTVHESALAMPADAISL
jgi:hypothetical protein